MTYKTDNRSNSYTRFFSACILTITLLCAAAFVCGTAGAEDIYVPEGGNQTIQQAVANATGGDAIIVRDGTYDENVDVTVAHLTIRSENGSTSCIVNAADSADDVFEVTADYVNISGFTATGATDGGEAGIYLDGRQHCNISNNNASGNKYGIYLSSSSYNEIIGNNASCNEYGIHVVAEQCGCYNNITDNLATNNDWDGISLDGEDNCTIANNNASNNCRGIYIIESVDNNITGNICNGNGNSWWGEGIYLGSSDRNTVSENEASGNTGYGICTWSSSHNEIAWNNASGNGAGISDTGSGLECYNNIIDNTVNNNAGVGIELQCEDNCTIARNTVSDNNGDGILLIGSFMNNVTCNYIFNNTCGIHLGEESVDNNISCNNIIANGKYNTISGGYEWQFNNDQSDDVDATNNWWGTTNNDTINASILDWQDDSERYGNVTYLPKLGGRSVCAPIPELATIALLAVGLLMLVGYVRIGRRK